MLASAPARSMNHIRANLGIPYDSISDERALARARRSETRKEKIDQAFFLE